MKSHPFPRESHTVPIIPSGVSPYAPCRNRTCNLMIKSHGTDPASQRVRVFATIKIATPPHQVSATRTRQSPTDLIYSPKEDGSLSNALLIWKVLA